MSAAAVDSATAQMADTTLSEPSSTARGASIGSGGDKAINASSNDAVIQSAAEGRRLYIGNLAYATTEGELKEFFKGYLVESISIPLNPRTTRPVGYAFVDVSTPSEAQRACSELNEKTVLERIVSVQLARKPEEAGEKAEKPTTNGEGRRRNSGRGRGRGKARGGRAGRGDRVPRENGAAETDASASAPTIPAAQVLPLTETTNDTAPTEDAAKSKSPKAPKTTRAPRQRGPPEDGVPSKTKIMVANLPYDLKEEALLDLFKAYSPVSAKIALRPIPRFMVRKLQARNEPRKGRGFAFVTLPSEDVQQKAISDMNGKEVDGRELAVKVAIDSPGKEDDALNAQADKELSKENGTAAADSAKA